MKIKKMDAKEFWPLLDKNSPKVFNHQFYPAYQHMTTHEAKGAENRKKFLKDRIELFWGLFDDQEKFVGWTCSFQMRPNELYMMSSGVLAKYRRSGWYTKLVEVTVKEAKRLGFQMITSNHITSNNSVIIAKLKLGFQIAGIEIFDEIGTVVKLVHYLSPIRQEVFSYRTGEVYPSTRVKKVLGFTKNKKKLAT